MISRCPGYVYVMPPLCSASCVKDTDMKAGPHSWAPWFHSFPEQTDKVFSLSVPESRGLTAVTVLGSCYGLNSVPPDLYVKVPVPPNMTLCGDRVFIEVN